MNNKIAIISDSHNNLKNIKKVTDYCKREKISTLLCCGDLASMEALDLLNDNFSGKIHYVLGNMDNDHLKDFTLEGSYKNTSIYQTFGKIEIAGKKIAIVHYPNMAEDLCKTGKYRFVFHGHSHKPWISSEKGKKCTLLNPGNLAGDLYPPTFAVWNTKTDEFDLIKVNEL